MCNKARPRGGYGVDIFFSLSGFLICSLLLKEKDEFGRIDLGRFYLRRSFRILPALVTYLTALVVLRNVGEIPEVTNAEVIFSLAFGRNYASGSWYTAHFWSLAIEEHFYLIVPVLFYLLRWRQALAVAICLSLGSVILRAVEYRTGFVQNYLPWTTLQFRTEVRFDGLMNGAILALLLHQPKIRDWFTKMLSLGVMIGLFALTLIAVMTFSSQPERRTITALVIPLFIAFTVLHPSLMIGRLLEWPAIRWVGRLSYSLYLWQQLVLIPFDVTPSPGFGLIQRSFFSVIPALACAIASYYLIEKPMIRIGHRLASRNPVPASNPLAPGANSERAT